MKHYKKRGDIMTEKELVKINVIRIIKEHKRTCNSILCNISLDYVAKALELAGIELTKEEKEELL